MRRLVFIALPCVLAAGALLLFASGTFRGRGPDQNAPAADDGLRSGVDKPEARLASTNSAKPLHQPYPFKRVVVVAVGINQYPRLRGTTDLRYAEADATEFADVCEALYGFEVVRLTGE